MDDNNLMKRGVTTESYSQLRVSYKKNMSTAQLQNQLQTTLSM